MLYKAQKECELATAEPYAMYAILSMMPSYLLCWDFWFNGPTILTLIMFPILLLTYRKLARKEEQDMLAEFGEEYSQYMAKAPGFIPEVG